MTSFLPFARQVHCPVAEKAVVVSGVGAPISGQVQVMCKACSNSGECLPKFGALEKIDGCLLHTLSTNK